MSGEEELLSGAQSDGNVGKAHFPVRWLMANKEDSISRIGEALGTTGLVGWQFAAYGNWDKAERIFFETSSAQAADRIPTWLNQQTTDNIAFEALFELTSGERFFFGVRISDLKREAQARVIHELLTASQKGNSLAQVVQKVRTSLDAQQLAGTTPEYLELGVFDLWNKVKSLVVWKKNEKLGAVTAILLPEEIQRQTPKPHDGFAALYEPQTKPLMLEAAWKRNAKNGQKFQCWLSLPVSEFGKTPEEHTLAKDKYLAAAAILIGYNPFNPR